MSTAVPVGLDRFLAHATGQTTGSETLPLLSLTFGINERMVLAKAWVRGDDGSKSKLLGFGAVDPNDGTLYGSGDVDDPATLTFEDGNQIDISVTGNGDTVNWRVFVELAMQVE